MSGRSQLTEKRENVSEFLVSAELFCLIIVLSYTFFYHVSACGFPLLHSSQKIKTEFGTTSKQYIFVLPTD